MVKVNGAWCRSYSPCAIVGYLESTNVTKIIRTLLVGGMGEIENLEGIAPNTPQGYTSVGLLGISSSFLDLVFETDLSPCTGNRHYA